MIAGTPKLSGSYLRVNAVRLAWTRSSPAYFFNSIVTDLQNAFRENCPWDTLKWVLPCISKAKPSQDTKSPRCLVAGSKRISNIAPLSAWSRLDHIVVMGLDLECSQVEGKTWQLGMNDARLARSAAVQLPSD